MLKRTCPGPDLPEKKKGRSVLQLIAGRAPRPKPGSRSPVVESVVVRKARRWRPRSPPSRISRATRTARRSPAIIAAGLVPRCLELLDSATLGAVRAQGVAIDARAQAMLLIEVDGGAYAIEPELARLGDVLSGVRGVVDVVAAQDKAQRDRLSAARKVLSRATTPSTTPSSG